MIFILFLFLNSQLVPVSPQLNVMGIDFVALLPDSETDIFLNPVNAFFWNKFILFLFSTYHNYLFLSEGQPISFQTLLNVKIGKEDYFFNVAYHYLFSNEKRKGKSVFFNYHNLPFSIGYSLSEVKIGLGIGYQQFYFKKIDTLNQNLIEKRKYLPFKIGLATGAEEKFETMVEFVPFDSNNFSGYQLNLITKKIFGESDQHIFLFEIDYIKNNIKNWKFISGYCLSSRYNFYGFVFNNFFSAKPVISLNEKKEYMIKIIFPYALICSFGKMKFLFGLRNELFINKENIYFTDYTSNFSLNYRLSNNFEFYFSNFPVNTVRKWFFGFKFSF